MFFADILPMKQLFFICLLLFMATGLRAETCTVTVKEIQKGESFKVFGSIISEEAFNTTSAHACFEKALNKAANLEGEVAGDVEGWLYPPVNANKNTNRKVVHHKRVIVGWEYNDGYVNDSDGSVSKYSQECIRKNNEKTSENFLGSVFRYEPDCKEKY